MTVFRRGKVWAYDFQRDGARHTASGFPSKSIAKDAEDVARGRLLDQRLAREYGLQMPRARIPILRDFIEKEFLPGLKGRVAPSTYTGTRAISLRLAEALGRHRIPDITVQQLESYRNQRAVGQKASSLRTEFGRIRQVFRAAVEAGYLLDNPARRVGLPREERGPDRILTEEEQDRLLLGCWTEITRQMIRFALWTALRPGELCGLRGKHVDLAGRRLYLPQPKVKERPKVIPLVPEAVAILKTLPPAGPNDPVFRGAFQGKAVRENVFRRAFKTAVMRAGIPPIRPQDLRHTVAVRLIRKGADLATVGDILGHKPPYRTTARYLAHTNEARKREVLSRLSSTRKSQLKG